MALALITLTTFIDFRSIIRAPDSVLPAEAVTTTSDSSADDSFILIVSGEGIGLLIACVE